MTVHKNSILPADKITEQDVARYLRNHPDFFEHYQDLLADMVLVHNSGSAVSLIERQVSILREQNDDARTKLHALIDVAEKNESLNQRFNALVLALLDTKSIENVIEFIQQRLVKDFDAHRVSIRIFNTATIDSSNISDEVRWGEPSMLMFDKIIQRRLPVCGRLPIDQLELLFSDDYEKIRSAALIPLIKDENSTCLGLLSIGSTDKNRFRADMGTLFLSHLSKVLTRVIERHVMRDA